MKSENDVRKWLREQLGDRVLWIEFAPGGTEGMPDALVMVTREVPVVMNISRIPNTINKTQFAPVELKFGGVEVLKDRLRWTVKMRPAQLEVMRRITSHGGKYFVLVGSELENVVGLVTFHGDRSRVKNGHLVKLEPISSGGELLGFLKDQLK